jgi:hypothetical protein
MKTLEKLRALCAESFSDSVVKWGCDEHRGHRFAKMNTDNDKLKSSFEFKRNGVLQPEFIGVDLQPACRAIAQSATASERQFFLCCNWAPLLDEFQPCIKI